MALSKRQRNRKPIFCDRCGRITYENADDYQWWLVGNGVIRCPQHITTWTLRLSGKGRHMANYRWARMAKEQDTYDPAQMAYEPFFSEDDF